MLKTRSVPAGLSVVLALSVLACASTEQQGEMGAAPSGDEIAVHVANDLVPGQTVVVWMVPETGGRRRLGSISPNGQATFTYLPTARSMEFQLVAEVSGGGRQTSRGFSLVGVNAVRWEVSGPTVSIVR